MQFPEIPGVSFSLGLNGEDIPVQPDGSIARRLNGGTSIDIDVEVFSALDNWHPFILDYNDRNRTPRPSRPMMVRKNDGSKSIFYRRRVHLQRTRQNQLVAYSQKNNLRMMYLTEENIDIFTVALIVQNGSPWFVADVTYQAKINGDTIEYDRKWATLFQWIEKIHQKKYQEKQVDPELPNPASFDETTGLVIWWDSSSAHAGSGCVMTDEGQASVHWSNVQPRPDTQRRFLKIGERVVYDHKRIRDNSGFPFELVDVQPSLT